MSQEIIHGDCLNEMRLFSDNHFSGIVTDPPYGLQFMGKQWDQQVPGKEYWKEMFRVCKPGSFLLAFGGTRTYHRLACAIEDAGWEIRDCLQWIYGSGFPKSHNHFGMQGYGTALKPAYEPIVMAMKPLDGTFAQNAEKWGQAGINIDECRIESIPRTTHFDGNYKGGGNDLYESGLKIGYFSEGAKGRWPANIILDEEAGEMLDEMSGNLKSGIPGIRRKPHNTNSMSGTLNLTHIRESGIGDIGGASRFFYCAKASSSERGTNNKHPTVKPLKLMEYLLKLISPPKDAIILDPFAGSGTTLLAAKNLGISCIGIEKEEAYCEIILGRLNVKQLNFMEALA